MRARNVFLSAVAVLALGLPIARLATSGAAPRRSSGPARECYDCHAASRAEFKKKKFLHAPLLKNDCAACHRSHGFSQSLVLQKPADQVCLDCHGDLLKAAPATHQHPAFKRGDCLGCHDPHASDRPHLVRDETPVGSCFQCHSGSADESKLAHQHEPFRKGNCVACHEAHQGPNSALVRTKGDALCTGCHALAQVDAKHVKTMRRGLECLDCHSPHASARPALTRDTAHDPVASGDCESCHVMEGGKPSAKLVAQGAKLCVECHDNKADVATRAHPHDPAAEGDCLACHDAHRGTSAGKLLKAPPGQLCMSCHDDLADQRKLPVVHRAFAEGRCADCHDPHGSANPALARTPDGTMCLKCHSKVEHDLANPQGVHPPAAKRDCLRCHAPHASTRKALLRQDEQALCLTCHRDAEKALDGKKKHAPFSAGSCTACHQPHASALPRLKKADDASLCLTCHAEVQRELTRERTHSPAKAGKCLTCHGAHGGGGKGMLSKPAVELCGGCHATIARKVTLAGAHTIAARGDCQACHEPHGSKLDHLLRAPAADLCVKCHADVGHEGDNVHPPVEDRDCLACHDPHGGPAAPALAKPVPALCLDCHETDTKSMKAAHKGADVTAAKCLSCHGAHASKSAGLMPSHAHPGFAEQNCTKCHGVGAPSAANLAAPVAQLCVKCHSVNKPKAPGEQVHAPVAKGACLSCHSPHASNQAKLLVDAPDRLCTRCHAQVAKDAQARARPPSGCTGRVWSLSPAASRHRRRHAEAAPCEALRRLPLGGHPAHRRRRRASAGRSRSVPHLPCEPRFRASGHDAPAGRRTVHFMPRREEARGQPAAREHGHPQRHLHELPRSACAAQGTARPVAAGQAHALRARRLHGVPYGEGQREAEEVGGGAVHDLPPEGWLGGAQEHPPSSEDGEAMPRMPRPARWGRDSHVAEGGGRDLL